MHYNRHYRGYLKMMLRGTLTVPESNLLLGVILVRFKLIGTNLMTIINTFMLNFHVVWFFL